MNNFKLITQFDVRDVLAQLDDQPERWDEHQFRTVVPRGPFQATSDIWVRYRPLAELTEPKKFAEPHFAEFYPVWWELSALHPIVYDLMAKKKAVYLGGILITKIPAGGKIAPHHDRGSWHAEYMNCKVYVPLRANENCINKCEDESIVMRAGEAWSFNNLVTHSVENNGDTDRVTLIVCMRVE